MEIAPPGVSAQVGRSARSLDSAVTVRPSEHLRRSRSLRRQLSPASLLPPPRAAARSGRPPRRRANLAARSRCTSSRADYRALPRPRRPTSLARRDGDPTPRPFPPGCSRRARPSSRRAGTGRRVACARVWVRLLASSRNGLSRYGSRLTRAASPEAGRDVWSENTNRVTDDRPAALCIGPGHRPRATRVQTGRRTSGRDSQGAQSIIHPRVLSSPCHVFFQRAARAHRCHLGSARTSGPQGSLRESEPSGLIVSTRFPSTWDAPAIGVASDFHHGWSKNLMRSTQFSLLCQT
jgi:hypothetical protein